MSNLPQKNKLFIALGIGVVGVFLGVILGNFLVRGSDSQLQKEEVEIPETIKGAKLFLTPGPGEIDVGDTLALEVKLDARREVISGVAVRLVYSYEEDIPLEPQDKKMKVNPILAGMDWVFPVNSVTVDAKNRQVVIELAAVNLNPTGFPASEVISLATIDFMAQSSSSRDLFFQFDPAQTRLLGKNSNEIELELKGGVYSVD